MFGLPGTGTRKLGLSSVNMNSGEYIFNSWGILIKQNGGMETYSKELCCLQKI